MSFTQYASSAGSRRIRAASSPAEEVVAEAATVSIRAGANP